MARIGPCGVQGRFFNPTKLILQLAPGPKTTAGGPGRGRWDQPGNRRKAPTTLDQARTRGQKAACVGVAGIPEELPNLCLLSYLTTVENQDSVSALGHKPKIVGDQEHA